MMCLTDVIDKVPREMYQNNRGLTPSEFEALLQTEQAVVPGTEHFITSVCEQIAK